MAVQISGKLINTAANPSRVTHGLEALVAQRVFALALGYEDVVDHEHLRQDQLLALLAGRSETLAGKSTLGRLERSTSEGSAADRYKKILVDPSALEAFFVDMFIEANRHAPPRRIILDLDATDDTIHGAQEEQLFHCSMSRYTLFPPGSGLHGTPHTRAHYAGPAARRLPGCRTFQPPRHPTQFSTGVCTT